MGVGDVVGRGGVIGTLQRSSSHCFPRSCLHWGLRRGEAYLDPLTLVGAGPIRLLPLDSAPFLPLVGPLLGPSARDPTSAGSMGHMNGSFVVTGGGRGIGRAITERLARVGPVVVIELESDDGGLGASALQGVEFVLGSATEPDVAREAARLAARSAPLTGWVNNAAVFRDAVLPDDPEAVLSIVDTNLRPAIVGCAVAVASFREQGRPARSSTSRRTRPSARCGVRSPTPPRRLRSRA